MKKQELITLEQSDFDRAIAKAVEAGIERYEKKRNQKQLYTINEVSKKLGKAHKTVAGMIERGIIKATADNRIPHQELENYLIAQ